MNIIFLDMDGVLNCSSIVKDWQKKFGNDKDSFQKFQQKYCPISNKKYLYFIVPELLTRFNEMYSKINDCKIVWSSSWRTTIGKDSKLFIEGFFYQCGFPKNSFLSYTPNLRNVLRYNEIEEWIRIFKPSFKIDKCAIIDDLEEANPNTDQIYGIPIKFFKTSMNDGLTEKIANNIIEYFNKENKI